MVHHKGSSLKPHFFLCFSDKGSKQSPLKIALAVVQCKQFEHLKLSQASSVQWCVLSYLQSKVQTSYQAIARSNYLDNQSLFFT